MNKNIMLILIGLTSLFASAQSIEENQVIFTSGQRATIILPQKPDVSKGKYYRLDRCEDLHIIFEEEHYPQARTPYIIVPKEDFCIDVSALDLDGIRSDSTNIVGVSFIGTYYRDVFGYTDSFYYYILDSTPDCRNEEDKSVYLGPLHAFLEIDWRKNNHQNYEKMEVVLHDNPNSILLHSEQPLIKDNTIYDLSGRKVSSQSSYSLPTRDGQGGSLRKGIYIQNGKKVAVK